jgi:hypothetical protein
MPTLKNTLIETIPAKRIPKLASDGEAYLTKEFAKAAEPYNRILRFPRQDIASAELIELVYEMLIKFKMNSRGAKLSELLDFKKSIKKHAKTIQSLAKYKLEKVKEEDDTLKDTISTLFCGLDLVATDSRLVTFSKAMHFLLPDLFMPIDRRYTIQFFYDGTMPNNQKECFLQVFEQYRQFAQKHHEILKLQVDKTSCWNRNLPKVIDNIIIAYVSEQIK